jgi:hydrogenase nickel incorporation protein HypA/HybF
MHELSIAESVVAIVKRHAAGGRVACVELKVGHLRQVVPSALTFAFELLVEGTALEGAELRIEEVPAAGICRECGAESTMLDFPLRCASCGALDVELVAGEELQVDALELDASFIQTQCLVQAEEGCTIDVVVQFWEEETERQVVANGLRLDLLDAPVHLPFEFPAGRTEERWRSPEGVVEIGGSFLDTGLFRLSVRISDESPFAGDDREEDLRRAICSTYTILQVERGAFASLTDPPEGLREEAEHCENVGTWPVLVGGGRDTVLSAPIILPDHLELAPARPGDLKAGSI